MPFFKLCHQSVITKFGKSRWNQIFRTCFHTSSTVDTCQRLKFCHCIFTKAKKERRSLCCRHIQSKHGKSHHWSTGNNLLRLHLKSTRSFYQLLIWCTHAIQVVRRIGNRIARDSCYTFHYRDSILHCIINSNHGFHIIYNTSCIRRQHLGVNCSASYCINELSLTTLRILCHQFAHFHTRLIFHKFLQLCNCVRLIIFNAKYALCFVKQLKNYLHSCNELLRCLHHSTIISSQIWFTLCTVCDDIFNFFRFLW